MGQMADGGDPNYLLSGMILQVGIQSLLRMGACNPNTFRFGGDCTPQSFDKVIGFLGTKLLDALLKQYLYV